MPGAALLRFVFALSAQRQMGLPRRRSAARRQALRRRRRFCEVHRCRLRRDTRSRGSRRPALESARRRWPRHSAVPTPQGGGRRMSAAVPPIIAFRDSCQAHALAVRNGAEDLREAGDALQNLAQALGIKELGGQDEVQALISATMNGGLAQSLDEASEQEKATVDAWE